MPETTTEPETPQADEVRDRAVDAAMAVFEKSLRLIPPRRLIAEALEAAGDVYDADNQADADRLVADAGLISMESLPDRGVRVRIALGLGLAARMLGAFREVLDASPKAINYVEQHFVDPATAESYVVIVCRPGGLTPHQLRLAAEQERDDARARLAAVHDRLTRIDDGDDDAYNTPESTAEYVVARYQAVAASEEWAAGEIGRLRAALDAVADLAYRAGSGAAAVDALAEIQTRARRAAQVLQPTTGGGTDRG